MKQYEIRLTKKQLHTISAACDFYGRWCAGQFRLPNALEAQEMELQKNNENFWETIHYVGEQLNILSAMVTKMPMHGSYGIGSKKLSEEAKISYDISRPIMELNALESKERALKEGKESFYSVYDSPGLSYSQEGRITIKTIEDD